MSHNVGHIVLPDSVNKCELLTEVVRAHLHSGVPSTAIGHFIQGAEKYLEECIAEEDKNLCKELIDSLTQLRETYREKENKVYA